MTGAAAILVQRFRALPQPSLTNGPVIEPGTLNDYRALAKFHYRSSHPGGATSVLRIVHVQHSLADRFHGRTGLQPVTIGVLVRSLPALSCALRDTATNGRYCGLSRRDAAVTLNREVRTISRVVIDPCWRGLGLAVRLVRHALAHPEPGVLYTEALAAMGRASPFFERAGMIRYDRPHPPHAARLLDAMAELRIVPHELAATAAVEQRLAALPGAVARREWFVRELRRWRRAEGRLPRHELDALSFADLLRAARDRLLFQPMYYLHRHELTGEA